MQNKGLIKFFAILFAIVSIYQLTFTFVASNIKNDAKSFASTELNKLKSKGVATDKLPDLNSLEVKYLDSLKKVNVFSLGFADYTYADVSAKQINKGLDLEGGINVILQISVKDVLRNLANDSKNPVFNKALENTKSIQQGNESYLDAFFRSFDAVSGGTTKLASPDIFANKNLADEINFKMSDDQVKRVIRKKVNESVESAFEVLRKRIDQFGVTQPNIQKLGESGRILVELPGAKDVDRITKIVSGTAKLEFWETYRAEDFAQFFGAVNELLKKSEATVETDKKSTTIDSINNVLADKSKDSVATSKAKGSNPLFDKMAQGGGPILAVVSVKDTAKINSYLKRNDVKALLPADKRLVKFAWSKPDVSTDEKTKKVTETVQLYGLKGNKDGVAPLSGGVIVDARDSFDPMGKPSVSMQMNNQGAKVWENLTGKAYTEKGYIAIALDNVVYSAPGVTSGPIAGGRSEISGSFEVAETKDLANVLRAGKLPARAEIVQSTVVGPSLGQEAIDAGTTSSIVGLLLVCLWMVVYYGRAGWYANVALIVNLLFLFGILASLGAVLTLPGIAGIVLTLGTAVDANIIIYERAKEELRAGKTLEEALRIGYGWKGAMRSIIDANVTHILTGAILFIFGTGPIQGFATTLLIGIFTSLFTSIFIPRILMDRDIAHGKQLTFTTPWSKNWFTGFHFDFIGAKKWTYIISSTVIIVSCISFFTNGLDEGIDFVGGRTYQVKFEKPVQPEVVSKELAAVFDGSAEAKIFGSDDQLKITTKYKIKDEGIEVDKEVNTKLYDVLKKYFNNISYEQFTSTAEGKKFGVLQSMKVGPSISADIKTNAYWSVLGAMLIVGLYLVVSFRKWQYSLGAIAAIVHDVIFVLGAYSLLYKFMPFHMEMDQHFIAAILTVIGYSMNDTVIVFDRIREFLDGNYKGTFKEIVNASINTTLSRTINTSLTMIMVLLIMFIFGGDTLRGFVFAMLIGIVVGTYSSLFIATPVLLDSMKKEDIDSIEKRHEEANK
ncbi:SecD/SecF fusion protein [Flavobacterium croceum DSM 17960]|uniref:Multifunctional fusion protein n=1 Tax=Flavobacterium croceum DSM 17960 TaxID=1121886 RepID=A0A2S4N7N7_9FLAO|nr:protein translocase subunit SecDF [Flavobacterium croceum]POS01681.1 SecD/SecF fusion protein [Flavobacterium croceum DSM 17960]